MQFRFQNFVEWDATGCVFVEATLVEKDMVHAPWLGIDVQEKHATIPAICQWILSVGLGLVVGVERLDAQVFLEDWLSCLAEANLTDDMTSCSTALCSKSDHSCEDLGRGRDVGAWTNGNGFFWNGCSLSLADLDDARLNVDFSTDFKDKRVGRSINGDNRSDFNLGVFAVGLWSIGIKSKKLLSHLAKVDNSVSIINMVGQVGNSDSKFLAIRFITKAEGCGIAIRIQDEDPAN